MSNEHIAYPLDWPPGWPRAKWRAPSPFRTSNGWQNRELLSLSTARSRLNVELERLGATYVVVSSNLRPGSDAVRQNDPGVAVYFNLKGKPHVLACDKWQRLPDNIAAIAKHIEALRGIDRWGVGSIERAFAGFTALPPPGASTEPAKRPWRTVLDVECPTNPDGALREAFLMLAESRFKAKARQAHPDAGGTVDAMAELNLAIEEARAELGQ